MKTKKLKGLLFLSAIFAGFCWGGTALASFGISPGQINANYLLAGSSFSKQFILSRDQASLSESWSVSAKISGEPLAGWISMDSGDSVSMPVGAQTVPVKINIKVPEGTALGNYNASVTFVATPDKTGSEPAISGVTTLSGVMGEISVTVTDQKILKLFINEIRAQRVETGSAMKFTVGVVNQGNISANPTSASVEVWDLGKKNILETNTITEFSEIPPFEQKAFPVFTVKPTLLAPGTYYVGVKIYSAENLLREAIMPVTIHEVGTMNKGELSAFYLVEQPSKANQRLSVKEVFKNIGSEKISAKGMIDVWRNGKFVESVQSEWKEVPVGDSVEFELGYTPKRYGNYIIRGYADHNGVKTAEKEISLKIGFSEESVRLIWLSAGGTVLLAAIIVLLVIRLKSKKKKDSKKNKK